MLVHKESEINSLCCKHSNFIIAFRTLQVYLGHKCGLVQYTVAGVTSHEADTKHILSFRMT
jgi:hypothetical protein